MNHVLLCLHGWGGSKESFTELREALKNDPIDILSPDLPGFGQEPEPERPWTTDDYADWVAHWIMKNEESRMKNMSVWILGHSHGGRIALKLAYRKAKSQNPIADYPIERLFLCASAGIRHPRHFKRILGLTLAKIGKFFLSIPGIRALQPIGKKFLYKLVRVHDYEQASPIMRQTLIEVSREDLRPILSSITIPTDIFWGENDSMTPVSDGHLMHDKIRGSTLHVYPGVRHRVHRDKAKEIAELIRGRIGT
ncbi:MAG: alpha/beta hydrolase [Candidatus Peribacteraceae bacterium]